MAYDDDCIISEENLKRLDDVIDILGHILLDETMEVFEELPEIDNARYDLNEYAEQCRKILRERKETTQTAVS